MAPSPAAGHRGARQRIHAGQVGTEAGRWAQRRGPLPTPGHVWSATWPTVQEPEEPGSADMGVRWAPRLAAGHRGEAPYLPKVTVFSSLAWGGRAGGAGSADMGQAHIEAPLGSGQVLGWQPWTFPHWLTDVHFVVLSFLNSWQVLILSFGAGAFRIPFYG